MERFRILHRAASLLSSLFSMSVTMRTLDLETHVLKTHLLDQLHSFGLSHANIALWSWRENLGKLENIWSSLQGNLTRSVWIWLQSQIDPSPLLQYSNFSKLLKPLQLNILMSSSNLNSKMPTRFDKEGPLFPFQTNFSLEISSFSISDDIC